MVLEYFTFRRIERNFLKFHKMSVVCISRHEWTHDWCLAGIACKGIRFLRLMFHSKPARAFRFFSTGETTAKKQVLFLSLAMFKTVM